MIDVVIRPIELQDLPYLARVDHSYHTDFVWQMEVDNNDKEIGIRFKEVRLPRSMRVDYPRLTDNFHEFLENHEMTFVAHLDGEPVGYASVVLSASKTLGIITDIAVLRRLRNQGIGSLLVKTVQNWLSKQGVEQIRLEMQSKNHPAICMANKLGFEFCGYSDRYYKNKDIALFFGKRV